MTSYDKSDIRFELSVCENLLSVKKTKKLGLCKKILGTNETKDYQNHYESEQQN